MIRLYAERFSEWKGLGEEVPFWLYVKRGLPTELEIQKGVERQRLIKNREIAAAELQRIDQDLRNIAQSTREEADLYYDLFLKADEDLRNMNEAYEDSYKESLWNLWHREYVAKLSQIIRYFLAPETRGGESSAQAFNRVLRKFQEVLNFRLTAE
jgi:broad specificity phosphatase PhoE